MDKYESNLHSRKNISKIPVTKADNKRLRVAAYCRISSRDIEQISSLNLQKWYYKSLIKENPNWIFAGIYADIGSGTQIKGRTAFQQVVKDCAKNKIDLILTKSVYWFARNTLDSLQTVRALKEKGIGIYFEQEGINTLTVTSEFLLTAWSAFAQNESCSKKAVAFWDKDSTDVCDSPKGRASSAPGDRLPMPSFALQP